MAIDKTGINTVDQLLSLSQTRLVVATHVVKLRVIGCYQEVIDAIPFCDDWTRQGAISNHTGTTNITAHVIRHIIKVGTHLTDFTLRHQTIDGTRDGIRISHDVMHTIEFQIMTLLSIVTR